MAAVVVGFAKVWVATNILAPLRRAAPLETRIDAMLAAVRTLYRGGEAPCLVASMLLTRGRDPIGADVGALIRDWIDALTATLVDAGRDEKDAAERATTAVITIEGALIVSRRPSVSTSSRRPWRRRGKISSIVGRSERRAALLMNRK